MEDNQIDKVQEAIAALARTPVERRVLHFALDDLRTVEPTTLLTQQALSQSRSTADPNHRQEEGMCSVLLVRHHEARKQPTGVPWLVTSGLQGEILETRTRPAKLHSRGLVMLLALAGLVFLAGGAMAPAQEFSRPILSSGLRDATHAKTQTIAKLGKSRPTESRFDAANLPPIESIGAASDIRPFLAPGVPTDLTRAALRRAWSTDPAIRDFVGLSENSWDFNAQDGVPGFGSPQRLAGMTGEAASSGTERIARVPTLGALQVPRSAQVK